MVQEKYNIHHLLPRSRGGNENKDNKVRFEVDQHVKFHGFFNHGIISEQIAQLIRLSDRALSKSVVEELCQLLKKEPECFYKDQVIKGEKILDRKYDSSGFFKENPKMLHHILPISRGGNEHDNNVEQLSVNTHENFSGVFSNTTFPEQILQLFLLSSSALEPEIIEEVLYFMKHHKGAEFFKEEVLQKPGNIFPYTGEDLNQINFCWNKNTPENQIIKNRIFNILKAMSKK